MTLGGADAFSVKAHSAEAVRISLQRIWETCLPKRRTTVRVAKSPENQYIVPDLNAPKFVRKRKEDGRRGSKEGRSVSARTRDASGNVRAGQIWEIQGQLAPLPNRKQRTTNEVLHWRTHGKLEADHGS